MISARLRNVDENVFGNISFLDYDLGPYTVRILEENGNKHFLSIEKTDKEAEFLPYIHLPKDCESGDYSISFMAHQVMSTETTEKVVAGYQIALEVVEYLKTHKLN